jgi:hypothetical protein
MRSRKGSRFTFNQIAETEAWLSDLHRRLCG